MASIGLNVDRSGKTPLRDVQNLNATMVRIVLMPDMESLQRVIEYAQANIRVLGVIVRESFVDDAWQNDAGLRLQLIAYQEKYGPYLTAWQIGNEPDQVSDSSWTMDQATLTRLTQIARQTLGESVILILGGLASGQPQWLESMDLRYVDAVAIHPYLKDGPNDNDIEDLPDVGTLLDAYEPFCLNHPLIITEWGWWGEYSSRGADEIYDMVQWAAGTKRIVGFFYFCHSDAMVPPFGLYRADGQPKMSYTTAFISEAADATSNPFWLSASAGVQEYSKYARDYSASKGLDEDIIYRQFKQESEYNPKAYNEKSGASGIAQIIPKFHPNVNVWAPMESLTYAIDWMAQLLKTYDGSYVKALAAYNWGPGNVNKWDGKPESMPEETRHYLDVILGETWKTGTRPLRVYYNPDEPTHPQEETFDCSQESLEWALFSVGRHPDDQWMESTMAEHNVMLPSVGLTDASGKKLAAFITYQWGEFGFYATATDPVTFDDVAREAGKYPLLVGFRKWGDAGHWTGVRSYDLAADLLYLANPANGYDSVYQTMSQKQFADRGPVSMVRLLHPDLTAVYTALTDEDRKGYQTAIKHLVNVVIPDIVNAKAQVKSFVDEAVRIRQQFTGE